MNPRRESILNIVEHPLFRKFIVFIIILNSTVLGVLTSDLPDGWHTAFVLIDGTCIAIFVVEILMRCYAHGWQFFKSGWNVFDYIVVVLSLMPYGQIFSVLRTIRALRVLRLISSIPAMRKAVEALLYSLPGVASAGALLLVVLYVCGVLGVNMFGEAFPQYFGHLGRTLFTLFQIMTLESWSMAIVRPIMEQFPFAWLYFISFILVSTFLLLNLLIGIVVDAIAHFKFDELDIKNKKADAKQQAALADIQATLASIQKSLK